MNEAKEELLLVARNDAINDDIIHEKEPLPCFCPDHERTAADDDEHSTVCRELRLIKQRLSEATADLDEGVLETSRTFYHTPEWDYMNALVDMSMALSEAAKKYDSKRLAEEALSYCLQRIGRSKVLIGSTSIEEMSFLLLQLDRLDDLWAFCQFFFRLETLSEEQRITAQSGKFPFAAEKDAHLLDPCEEYNRNTLQNDNHYVLPFLLALFLMKVRLQVHRQQEREENTEKMDTFLDTKQGLVLEQVNLLLKEMVKGHKEYQDPQALQAERLIGIIHQRNTTILPEMVFPEPLLEEIDEIEGLHFPRCPAEAWVTFMACRSEFEKTPKAKEILTACFGERPDYHTGPFDRTAEQIAPRDQE
jgi:hypothetical protein